MTTGNGLVVDDHRSAASSACACGLGHDGGDDVADEAHPLVGEDRPVQRRAASSGSPGTTASPGRPAGVVHGDDAGHRRGLADVDRGDVAVGDRAIGRSATWSMPGSTRSSTYLPSPVSSVGSSSRRTALPRIEPAPAMSDSPHLLTTADLTTSEDVPAGGGSLDGGRGTTRLVRIEVVLGARRVVIASPAIAARLVRWARSPH